MLALLTFVLMGILAYAMLREGMFIALCHVFNILFSGLLAFHFWPPLAGELESSFQGSFMEGLEDAVALVGVFALVLGILRIITTALVETELDVPPKIIQAGGAIFGAVGGFFLAGFLTCVLQTLPWEENFMGFPAHEQKGLTARALPPDQIWLKIMKRSHSAIFNDAENADESDIFADFSYKYAKHRRYTEFRDKLPFPPPPPKNPPKKKKDPVEEKDPPEEKKDPPEEKKDPPEEKKDPPEEKKDPNGMEP